jgi:spermidine/putrescine transport system substrate-binding protein
MQNQRNQLNTGDATDDLARSIFQQFGSRGVTRRGLFRGTGLSAAALSGTSLLAACGVEGTQQTAESCVSKDLSDEEAQLVFSNWELYLDEKGKTYPTLEAFQTETGISVTYNTDVNGNNEFFAKVRNQLGDCQPTGRDLFVLSDWMAARMMSFGWLQELNKENLPNVEANLVESLRAPDWDPTRAFSVPWQSGLTGIAYNAKLTGEVSSFEELVSRPDLKGKVALLTEMADTMSFVLKLMGADPANFSDDEWDASLAKLEEIIASGQIRQFTGNDYTNLLRNGDIVACEAWSGDVIAMQYDDPDFRFVVPEEGLSLWSDNMLVPNKANHKTNAEKLMNYYYDPEVAARLSAWVNYICPVAGAEEAMASVDESLVGNPLIFPSEADLANTFAFMNVDTKKREELDKEFAQVIGA